MRSHFGCCIISEQKNCACQSFFMHMAALKKSGFPKEPAPTFKTYDLIEISC
ncbi:hypothetical protein GCWU000342_00942 [Shuttleworthella satelles DSM 14600]|uniref:Uncharacterized protein n=1 Tax=Shuttleworthella satelles DSM 14600 TaxID=626523 RepID=C4GAJ1_9FIRM|nr:hypothetical protein GCWU000342_00942 [Shuttleworthia satelles DSM 14600]